MNQGFDWQKDYYHRDHWYGLNDWNAVIAYIRALMEDSEVPWCFSHTRQLVLGRHTPLSQTLIQYLGRMRDPRGIEIIREKFAQLGPHDRTLPTPWTKADEFLQTLCLEELAKIGGQEVRDFIAQLRADPTKAHLRTAINRLKIAPHPRPARVPLPPDFPAILRDIHSMNGVLRDDDDNIDSLPDCDAGSHDASIIQAARAEQRKRRAKRDLIVSAWRGLTFPGKIEFLSGDGHSSTFKLEQRFAGLIHNRADPFSDLGVFNSGPKIEHPPGRRRWAHSHTFLHYAVPDGSLWNYEYIWDEEAGTITTHFREHVPLEPVKLNPDGLSVTVAHRPISTVIETRGNVHTLQCNAAVRGVWDNPQRQGKNYYARRANVLLPYKDLCYFAPLHQPLVNIHGAWIVDESERPERYFDSQGNCIDADVIARELLIPLDEPRVLALSTESYKPAEKRDRFGIRVARSLWPELMRVPSSAKLDRLMGVRFDPQHCGLAGWEMNRDNGYNPFYDLNADGLIDESDRAILAARQGEVYRDNLFQFSYFGENWLATSYGCRSRNFTNHMPLYICAYDYGAGYDCETGKISLFESPPANVTLYAEYHYDAPALPGKENIKVYLHEPLRAYCKSG